MWDPVFDHVADEEIVEEILGMILVDSFEEDCKVQKKLSYD